MVNKLIPGDRVTLHTTVFEKADPAATVVNKSGWCKEGSVTIITDDKSKSTIAQTPICVSAANLTKLTNGNNSNPNPDKYPKAGSRMVRADGKPGTVLGFTCPTERGRGVGFHLDGDTKTSCVLPHEVNSEEK